VCRLDDVVVTRYLLGPGGPDRRFLRWAIELSRQCPPSASAFSVGAVIVAEDGEVLATGFSREQEETDHAEEVALRKVAQLSATEGSATEGSATAGSAAEGRPALDPRLRHATIYTSLVPCAHRASRPVTCVQHILEAGIPRVVYAWDEPPVFAVGGGAEKLRTAGVQVTEISELAETARSVNNHLTPNAR
jgi:diaminohydroxyphosphoribosylaminopyrimidine deaminase / 5-amino-6-(5-phosphoribosylamino)uracil reductase